ncbi:hypothetical protein L209DRAFT_140877 [Thermothelomyces heterothallicus CBS 203.75]
MRRFHAVTCWPLTGYGLSDEVRSYADAMLDVACCEIAGERCASSLQEFWNIISNARPRHLGEIDSQINTRLCSANKNPSFVRTIDHWLGKAQGKKNLSARSEEEGM